MRWSFAINSFGKPALVGESADSLQFNLSRSQNYAVYGISRNSAIGIDLECVREELEEDGIASGFLAREEAEMLRALPAALRARAFYDCGTRKEAYLKARGEGLSIGLDQFVVSLNPGVPAAILKINECLRDERKWSVRTADAWPGFSSAFVVAKQNFEVRCWNFHFQ